MTADPEATLPSQVPRPHPGVPASSQALLVVVLAGVQFLVVLDSLAVALALPMIGVDLGMGTVSLAWVVTAYSVALASGLLLAGRLSDLYGHRPVLLAGLVLLTFGGVVAAAAGHGAVLIAARVVQGWGAALGYPPALSLTAQAFPKEPWRGRAFAAGAVAGASGTVAGAVFGGVVTSGLGWEWTFGLTVPPGLLLLGLGLHVLPRRARAGESSPAVTYRRRLAGLDLPGTALAAAAVTSLLVALSYATGPGWTDRLVLVSAGTATAAVVLLLLQQRRAAAPLIPVGLLQSRRLLGGCVGIAANSVVYSAVVFIGTLHLQNGADLTPAAAGLAFLPVSVASMLAGAFGITRIRRRAGSARTATAGLVLAVAALLLLAASPTQPQYLVHLLPAYLMIGVALTAAFVSFTEHTIGGARPADRGVTSGVFETSTHLGGAISVTGFATAMATVDASGGHRVAYLSAAALVTIGATASATLLATEKDKSP